MLAKTLFKKSALSQSLNSILFLTQPQKRLCLSIFVTLLVQQGYANDTFYSTQIPLDKEQKMQSLTMAGHNASELDRYAMLQQEQHSAQFFKINDINLTSIEDDLICCSITEDLNIAEKAKKEAQLSNDHQSNEVVIGRQVTSDLVKIDEVQINVDTLMEQIESNIQVVEKNINFEDLPVALSDKKQKTKNKIESNFFQRVWYKFRPPLSLVTEKIPKIGVDIKIVNAANAEAISDAKYAVAVSDLKNNIKAKLSSFTQEALQDDTALTQLRILTREAAQAVGFYQAEFDLEINRENNSVSVEVTPNQPVIITSLELKFSGDGGNVANFESIKLLPELDVNDVFNHGQYELIKEKINEVASDNGFFTSHWSAHNVTIMEPENTAAITLEFETGERYKLGDVDFRMSDPSKPLPLNKKILNSLVPWNQEKGSDYTSWRVNTLADNLTNTRYFNNTSVQVVKPDPIIRPFAVEANQNSDSTMVENTPDLSLKAMAIDQSIVDESQFYEVDKKNIKNHSEISEQRQMEYWTYQESKTDVVPVIVELNADKLNSIEMGFGFGTDTGPRVRSQYRRAIVNESGHSFDANMEVSKIRQAVEGHYNIPYTHPLNDYVAIVAGYEREERDRVAEKQGLLIESAVFGADRMIKHPLENWQHAYGVRYRLDRISIDGDLDQDDIPETFLGGRSDQQQSLLLGYAISRVDSDDRVNPLKGIRQRYKVEVGSDALLTDVNLAIVNAAWNVLYSFGKNENHQVFARAELGYIITNDFTKVPYNLRYFTGGDQTIRGFDYKSLSPEIDDYKVGGQALGIGSLEYNYQFKEGWRAAIFTDVGNAYDKNFSNPTAYGVGVGLRWASPIGSIRVDIASGISDKGHPVRLHFFIGPQL